MSESDGGSSIFSQDDVPKVAVGSSSFTVASATALNVKLFGGSGVGLSDGAADVGVMDGGEVGVAVTRIQLLYSRQENKHALPRSVLSQFLW
jgi:hypothetical protein